VHDGEEEEGDGMKDDQDNLFMAAPTLNFNIIEEDHME